MDDAALELLHALHEKAHEPFGADADTCLWCERIRDIWNADEDYSDLFYPVTAP